MEKKFIEGSNRQLLKIIFISIMFYFFIKHIGLINETFIYFLRISLPFIIGGILAFIINIPMKMGEKILRKLPIQISDKKTRLISMTLSYLLIIMIFLLLITMIIPNLVEAILELQKNIPIIIEKAIKVGKKFDLLEGIVLKYERKYRSFNWEDAFKRIKGYLDGSDAAIINSILITATSVMSQMVSSILAVIFSIYLLSQKEKLSLQGKKLIYASIEENKGDRMVYIFSLLHEKFEKYIQGQILDSIILGIITLIILTIVKIPYAVTVSVIVLFTNLIPIIGAIAGGVVGFIFILMQNTSKAFLFLGILIILQQIESNVIYPRVVGDSVGLPGIWTLVAIGIGGSLFGVVGMWTFVPLFSVAYTLLREYVEKSLKDKGIDRSRFSVK